MKSYLYSSRYWVLLALLGLFSASGCGEKMDRKKAEQLINRAFGLPFGETRYLITGDREFYGPCTLENVDKGYHGEILLQTEGYRTVTCTEYPPDYYSGRHCFVSFQFTDKARRLLLNPTFYPSKLVNRDTAYAVFACEIRFGAVTSMRKVNEGEYEVDFFLTRVLSPFGEAYNERVWTTDRLHYAMKPEDLMNLRVRILRYDEGWSVATDDIPRIEQKLNPTGNPRVTMGVLDGGGVPQTSDSK